MYKFHLHPLTISVSLNKSLNLSKLNYLIFSMNSIYFSVLLEEFVQICVTFLAQYLAHGQ